MQTPRRLPGMMIVALAMICGHGAHADVIDGNWCYPDGHHFSIRGPDIVTPGGTSLKGSWSRHAFSYQIPPAEADAGQTIYMLLQDQNTVALAVGTQPVVADPAQVQIWHRCADQVSQLHR
jgi:hypothetical protein